VSQERKRRLAIVAFIVGGLAGGYYLSLDLTPGDRPAAWRGFALAAAGGGVLGALLGALERPVSGTPIAGLLESPPVLAGAVAVGVAVSAITARTFDASASMALVGACTGGAVAIGVAAILRER
jgi:hypothetical protein